MRRRIVTVTLALAAVAAAVFFLYPTYAAARWSSEFKAAAREADRLVIKTGGPCHPHPEKDVVRFETTDTNVIARLLFGLDAKSEIGIQCRCCGSPTVYFHKGGKVLAAVSMHHRRKLRWHGSDYGDVTASGKSLAFLLGFFSEHGVLEEDYR